MDRNILYAYKCNSYEIFKKLISCLLNDGYEFKYNIRLSIEFYDRHGYDDTHPLYIVIYDFKKMHYIPIVDSDTIIKDTKNKIREIKLNKISI